MDDIYLPDEELDDDEDNTVEFERRPVEGEKPSHPSGVSPSDFVKITFDRFVTLVANHSFVEVVEKNKNEEVIITTNLLTDLANARRLSPAARGPLLLLAGLVVGIFISYFLY